MFFLSLAVGPIQCDSHMVLIGALALTLLLVILLLSWACVCYTCIHAKCNDEQSCDTCIFSCACILMLVFIAFVITTSVFIFLIFESYTSTNINCKFADTPLAALSFSYFLIAMYCFILFCCICGPILNAFFCN